MYSRILSTSIKRVLATGALMATCAAAHADLLFSLTPGPTTDQTRVIVSGSGTAQNPTGEFGGRFSDFLRPAGIDLDVDGSAFEAVGSTSGSRTASSLIVRSESDGRDTLVIAFEDVFASGETVTLSGSVVIDLPQADLRSALDTAQPAPAVASKLYVRSSDSTRVIAVSGDPIVDTGGVLEGVGRPSINDARQIAFIGNVPGTDPLGGNNVGLFLSGGVPLGTQTLTRAGQSVDDSGSVVWSLGFTELPLSNQGTVALNSFLIPEGSTDVFPLDISSGHFSQSGYVQTLRTGDAAPDGSGVIDGSSFSSVDVLNSTSNGITPTLVRYVSPSRGGSSPRSLVVSSPQNPSPELILREGDVLPTSGATAGRIRDVVADENGDVVVFVNGDQTNGPGEIARYRNGQFENVLTLGESVDRGDTIAEVLSITEPGPNGQIAITATLTEAGTTNLYQAIVLLRDNQTPEVLAAVGDTNLINGETITSLELRSALASGDVLFFAGFAAGGGMFVADTGTMPTTSTRIHRDGDVSFYGDSTIFLTFDTALNSAGEGMVLLLQQGIDEPTFTRQLMFYRPGFGLLPIMTTNDTLLGSPVAVVSVFARGNSTADGINNLGQIAYRFDLEDGRSGVALWTPPGREIDSDGDGVADLDDNCLNIANPNQRDSDQDNLGNACDADIAQPNDCVVNVQDLGALRLAFFANPVDANWNPDADFNGDGVVNVVDLGLLRSAFFNAPGPSGLNTSCN